MNHFLLFLIATFLLNIPCGYWRVGVKKFSWQWFTAIHLPVPILILLRHFLHEEHSWKTTPIQLVVYLIGQFIGSLIRKKYRKIHIRKK